jgi:predicted metalloprotease with PDZ domain
MPKSQLFGFCTVTGLAGAVLLALLPVRSPAADAPPAPVTPAPAPAPAPQPPRPANNADVDAQLQAAQQRLEQAAHDVARLSTQLSSTLIEEMMPAAGTRVIIGVQLEPLSGKAGARVGDVSPGGPAAEAGIRAGDVIVALNGTALTGAAPAREVAQILRDVKPDSPVPVRVLREGKPLEFTVTARARPGVFVSADGMPDLNLVLPELPGLLMHRPLGDMELATLTPRLGSYFGSDKGVLVVRAPADGALKLEDGDVILAIDGREPSSGSHATRILSSYQAGEKVTLRILRQHKTLEVQSTLPERSGHRERTRRDASAATRGRASPKVVVLGAGAA